MITAALTGGIATGKSEIMKVAGDFSGIETVQADEIAKEIYEPENPCFDNVVEILGSSVVTEEGKIDLEEVAGKVFSSPDLLKRLEEISHPYVTGRLEGIIECLKEKNIELVLVEIPLLFQSSSVNLETFDLVILVKVDKEEQLKRLVDRDEISVKQAKERIRLQRLPDNAEKESDVVINTDGSLKETKSRARDLFRGLLKQ